MTPALPPHARGTKLSLPRLTNEGRQCHPRRGTHQGQALSCTWLSPAYPAHLSTFLSPHLSRASHPPPSYLPCVPFLSTHISLTFFIPLLFTLSCTLSIRQLSQLSSTLPPPLPHLHPPFLPFSLTLKPGTLIISAPVTLSLPSPPLPSFAPRPDTTIIWW